MRVPEESLCSSIKAIRIRISPNSRARRRKALVASERRREEVSRYLIRFVLFGTLVVLCALAVADGALFLAALSGVGAVFTGSRLLDREGNRRRELHRWARENERELGRVAREDRIAAPQMKRLQGLQAGLLESWELLPKGYGPLLDDDIFTIVGEIESAARLAKRRAALRRHLDSVDRLEISRRIEGLERDLAGLEEGSPLRAPFERALEGRRGELASDKDILEGISMINAEFESAESLLSNLRSELLALDTSPTSGSSLEPGLAHLKERVSYFRQSMDEVRRSEESQPAATAERLAAR
jgi:hypothetical protein